MGRLPEIFYNDVKDAYEKLESLEQRPTVDRVRELLGKGSRSTINRHMREYEQQEKNKIPNSSNVLTSFALALNAYSAHQNHKIKQLEERLEKLKEEIEIMKIKKGGGKKR